MNLILQEKGSADEEAYRRSVREHYLQIHRDYYKRSNKLCADFFQEILKTGIGDSQRVLEIGAGSSCHLESLPIARGVATDISAEMLALRIRPPHIESVVAAAESLPFADGSFDSVISVNLLEHVANLQDAVSEGFRVLRPGGRWVAITPNGNWRILLEIAEHLRFKLPEGPHKFLRVCELSNVVSGYGKILAHQTCLAFPFFGVRTVNFTDGMARRICRTSGFFQYVIAIK